MSSPLIWLLAVAIVSTIVLQPGGDSPRSAIADRVSRLTRSTEWIRVNTIPVQFRTFHPQGMVKIGDRFFVSSVEVHDREAGAGVGHLFQFDISGRLLADLTLGEGAMYHPGGIDYDGRHIWVPVAEYRRYSRSIVYRIDPKAMKAEEVLRFSDHLGAVVHDTDDNSLHAVSWGSRTFYSWPIAADGRVRSTEVRRTVNPSHYVDYQDCKYSGRRTMVCTGVTEIRQSRDEPPFRLGGIELIDLSDHRPLHQVPLLQWANGIDLTHNPAWLEPTADGVRGYFMPEDDRSTVYVLEAKTAR
jgi:hypothetical protein